MRRGVSAQSGLPRVTTPPRSKKLWMDTKQHTMMHRRRRPPPNAASLLVLVAAVVTAAVLSTPTKSFAFQTATPTTTTSLPSSRLAFPVKIATSSTRPSSSSLLSHSSSSSLSLQSSQLPFHHQNGKIGLSMSSDDSKEATSNSGGGTASIPNEVFNLVKSIVGAGVLSLPAGAC